MEKVQPHLLSPKGEEGYTKLLDKFGYEILQKVERQITLYYINKCWTDFLDYMAYVRAKRSLFDLDLLSK